MKCSRRVPVMLAMMVAVVLGSAGGLGSPLYAQSAEPRMRSETISAENLDNEQRQQIDLYVQYWGERLQATDDERVTIARRRLLEPLRATQVSQTFLRHYSERAGEALGHALASDRRIVRLNTMIVVARLTGPAALPLIEQGMADESDAVRYRAIKAVQTVDFNQQQKQALVARLVQHLDREPTVPVAEQTMVALMELDLPDARQQGLELLNQRVAHHLAEPGQSMQPELSGLARAYQQLARAGNPRDSQEALRQLSRAALRYQDLANRQLQLEGVPTEHRNSYIDTIKVCNAALQFVANNLNASGLPGSINMEVDRGNWAAVERNTGQWRTILQRAPFNFTEQDLAVGE